MHYTLQTPRIRPERRRHLITVTHPRSPVLHYTRALPSIRTHTQRNHSYVLGRRKLQHIVTCFRSSQRLQIRNALQLLE
jgi:hypothetical protein